MIKEIDREVRQCMNEIERICSETGHQLGLWQKNGQNGQSNFSNSCRNDGCGLKVGVKTLEGYEGMIFRTIGRYGFYPEKCCFSMAEEI